MQRAQRLDGPTEPAVTFTWRLDIMASEWPNHTTWSDDDVVNMLGASADPARDGAFYQRVQFCGVGGIRPLPDTGTFRVPRGR